MNEIGLRGTLKKMVDQVQLLIQENAALPEKDRYGVQTKKRPHKIPANAKPCCICDVTEDVGNVVLNL